MKCGCDIVNKSDYRGTINTTKDGSECVRWDDDWLSGYFSDEVVDMAGLEENYCRNPVNHTSGPGCYTFIDQYNDKVVLVLFQHAIHAPAKLNTVSPWKRKSTAVKGRETEQWMR